MDIDYNVIVEYIWENMTFEIFLKFSIIYFFIIWIALIIWVIKDIGNRTESILFQLFALLIIIFLTPLGIFIYLIIRPGKTLFERYYKEVDDNLDTISQIVEDKLKKEEESSRCIKCNYLISHEFRYCPNCKAHLKTECSFCSKLIFVGWDICPYCGEINEQKEENIEDKKINYKIIFENKNNSNEENKEKNGKDFEKKKILKNIDIKENKKIGEILENNKKSFF